MPAVPTFTFSGNPGTDTKDAVRALIQDTNSDGLGWLLSDETILWAIKTEGQQFIAAAFCAEMIAALYTGPQRNVAEKRIGDLMIQYGRNTKGGAEDWHSVARMWRRRASRGAVPGHGGIDVLDRTNDALDPSLIQPQFKVGEDDDPTTTSFSLASS